LAIPDTSISGKRVARELTVLIGKPRLIVSDNGTEFTSNAIPGWTKDRGVESHYIAPGKPTQNGYKTPAAYADTLTASEGASRAEALTANG
jgi:putative transposase